MFDVSAYMKGPDASASSDKKSIMTDAVGDVKLNKGVDSIQFLIPTANILIEDKRYSIWDIFCYLLVRLKERF